LGFALFIIGRMLGSYLMKSFIPSRTLAFYAMYGYKVRLK
jgi:fucose permease